MCVNLRQKLDLAVQVSQLREEKVEKNEKTETGDTDAAEDRIHSFHRLYTITFLKDLLEDSAKFEP